MTHKTITTMGRMATLAAMVLATQTAQAADDALMAQGFEVFNDVCLACHNDEDQGEDRQAPPMVMVKDRYARLGSREAFVAAVSSFVEAPSIERTLMRGAVRNFDVMPDLGVSAEDARAVAEFLYATDLTMPDWMAQHMEEEHGGQGQGQGQGQGHGGGHGGGQGAGQGGN
jgi:mono/diheme cytochrome c family protein